MAKYNYYRDYRCKLPPLSCSRCVLTRPQMSNWFSASGWELDETGIFAQVDAFAQRCQDLLEVCECQQQFGRYVDGQRAPLPCLGGQRGPAVARSLLETQEAFARALRPLAEARASILDVNNTAWHEHCNRFRASIKELEVMMQNLISSAFETVTMVTHGVELLDVFQHLSSREVHTTKQQQQQTTTTAAVAVVARLSESFSIGASA
ncbi:unnamed protein product [Lampetra fluviatilis]